MQICIFEDLKLLGLLERISIVIQVRKANYLDLIGWCL